MSTKEAPENPSPEIPEAEQIRYRVSWMAEPFVKLPGPYRPPQVSGPNIPLAAMLMRLWAGPNSELTQTLQLHKPELR
ncbi:MAG: hypothetical protein QMC81_06715, partial [Thermoanaerobacterales bacterium]|nr:hypothetical protein [Thermoanaerobacterales bacterium]